MSLNTVKAQLILNKWSKAAQAASVAKRRARQNSSPDLKMARRMLEKGDKAKAKSFVKSYRADEKMSKADGKAKKAKQRRDSSRTSSRGAGSGR